MDASLGFTHFTSASIVVFLINKLKAATWFPLLQKDWTIVNRSASIILAFLVAQGIAYAWNPSSRELTITIPTLSILLVNIWHWVGQYCMQETLHQMTKVKAPALPLGTVGVVEGAPKQ